MRSLLCIEVFVEFIQPYRYTIIPLTRKRNVPIGVREDQQNRTETERVDRGSIAGGSGGRVSVKGTSRPDQGDDAREGTGR